MPGSTSIEVQCQQVKRCVEIAVKCLEEDRHTRPTIADIIRYLHGAETIIARFVIFLSRLDCLCRKTGMTLIATKQRTTLKIYRLTL